MNLVKSVLSAAWIKIQLLAVRVKIEVLALVLKLKIKVDAWIVSKKSGVK